MIDARILLIDKEQIVVIASFDYVDFEDIGGFVLINRV